jgi:hypothetical protein
MPVIAIELVAVQEFLCCQQLPFLPGVVALLDALQQHHQQEQPLDDQMLVSDSSLAR